MSMAQWLFDSVESSPFQEDFSAGRIFRTAGFNAGADAPPEDSAERPFIILRAGINQNPRMPGSRIVRQGFQVWLHIDKHSLTPLDKLAMELQFWMPKQAPVKMPDGDVIMDCFWENTSGDLPDEHFQTTTRYVEFTVTANLAQPELVTP